MSFRYSFETKLTECDAFDGAFKVDIQRDGTFLHICDADHRVVASFTCEKAWRPIGEDDKLRLTSGSTDPSQALCTDVVIWKVRWEPIYYVPISQVPVITRELIQSFFEFWQDGLGSGCYIDGRPHQALVEVNFVR